jgi:putative phage-type endonuclease
MNRQKIERTDEASWLQERTRDVTSTEVAALFGLSPYTSEFELFHRKRVGEVVRIEENERMRWGKRLEGAIANGVAADNEWVITPANIYMRDPVARIGSSFDFLISEDGLMEIKNVDGLQFQNKWIDDGVTLEAPEHIELQIQHQMEVAERDYCILVALVGGNRVRWVRRERDEQIGAAIRERVSQFWDRVIRNDAPSPDYTMDADFIIKQLHANANDGEVIEADEALEDLIAQYQFVSREAAGMDELKSKTKAELLQRIGTASKVSSKLGTISCGMTKPSQGTFITPDMVGTHVGGRQGFRNFRFTPKKGD